MHDRNCFIVRELPGALRTQEEAETECERQAATSNSNVLHYVVKVVAAYRREVPVAKKVDCKFSGIEA